MALQLQIDLSGTAPASVGSARRAATDTADLHRVLAFALETKVKHHIRTRYATRPNRLKAPSTGFWKRAIESAVVSSDATLARLSLTEPGVALRYHGGTVTPTFKRALTIPVSPLAHGKRAAEFGRLLVYIPSKKPGQIGGLYLRHVAGTLGTLIYVLRASTRHPPSLGGLKLPTA
jgi:hypothetical protein